MDTLQTIPDYVDLAAGRLISQFRDTRSKRSFTAEVTPFALACQDLENVFFQLLNGRNIDTATGTQLDTIGALVGQPRDTNQVDDLYRLDIRFKILMNSGYGQPEDLIQAVMHILDADAVTLVEDSDTSATPPVTSAVTLTITNPRKLYASTEATAPNNGNLYEKLRQCVAAGVTLHLAVAGVSAPFEWAPEDEDLYPFAGGWAESNPPGGYLQGTWPQINERD